MRPQSTCFFILSAASLLLAGCSERGPHTIPVYGTVSFVGREAPKAVRLIFRPIKTEGLTRPAIAECASNGSYSAKAFSSSRGLIPGTYKIDVTYYDLTPGKDPKIGSSWAESNYNAGELAVEANSGGIQHDIEIPKKG
jgi:hypothetical protein